MTEFTRDERSERAPVRKARNPFPDFPERNILKNVDSKRESMGVREEISSENSPRKRQNSQRQRTELQQDRFGFRDTFETSLNIFKTSASWIWNTSWVVINIAEAILCLVILSFAKHHLSQWYGDIKTEYTSVAYGVSHYKDIQWSLQSVQTLAQSSFFLGLHALEYLVTTVFAIAAGIGMVFVFLRFVRFLKERG